MKFVTKRIHAFLDYPVAIALMVLPFVIGLGKTNSLALWFSVITGIAAFILTLLTNHHLGLLKVLPYKFHLTVDFIVGLTFILLPFVFSFHGLDAYYYWINGAAVLLVVSAHKPQTNS
ncbi:SPW repeat domain-containing protein [Tenacibaculum amylolyticum]|uniref:SPW repeat domain-containing protein n=1 Tax=Tenacibaculum amylolyticum TaxID=104269 RepID=UPI003893696A